VELLLPFRFTESVVDAIILFAVPRLPVVTGRRELASRSSRAVCAAGTGAVVQSVPGAEVGASASSRSATARACLWPVVAWTSR
jgi:hypothetical protein